MIHLRAKVRSERGRAGPGTKRTVSQNSGHVSMPDWIDIEQGSERGYLLIHVYLREGPFVHTWHETLEEAKAEAKEEFGINENQWVAVPPEVQAEWSKRTLSVFPSERVNARQTQFQFSVNAYRPVSMFHVEASGDLFGPPHVQVCKSGL